MSNLQTNQYSKKLKINYLISVLIIVSLIIGSLINISQFLHPTIAILLSVILVFVFLKITKSPLSMLGLKKVSDWKLLFSQALGLALIISFSFFFFIIPYIESLTNVFLDYSLFEQFTKDTKTLLMVLPIVWISAALFEEIIFRGFFITYSQKLFDKKYILLISILLSSILFGFAHSYQGVSGIIVTGLVGLILSLILVNKNYNLLFLIVIHAFIDTIYLLIFYFHLNNFKFF
jgi:hypothetical protein